MPASVADAIADANVRHGTRWRVVRRLTGGYLQGAYELVNEAGASAVFKWYAQQITTQQLDESAVLLDELRTHGWPTSRWLAYGEGLSGGAYVIEEFVAGEPPTRLDEALLTSLLTIVREQAHISSRVRQDWSAYIRRVVFEGEAGLAARMVRRSPTAVLMDRIVHLTAAQRDVPLPTGDAVHGDFVLRNMLVHNGRPYVIDAAHVGTGTRAYDLACLLLETNVDGLYERPAPSITARLLEECLALVTWDELLVLLACRMMHWLVFGEEPDDALLESNAMRCQRFLNDLELARSTALTRERHREGRP